MAIWDKWFKGKKKLSKLKVEELRYEEKRLQIRENQSIAELEKFDKQREEIFNSGAKSKSPSRRRIYARRFTQLSQRLNLIEREVLRLGKELITIGRMRSIFERKHLPGAAHLLEKLREEDLMKLGTMLEDDKISEEVYLSKLDTMLGIINDPALEASEIGQEGMEVLKTWEAMDEGDLEFDEGLKQASGGKVFREKPKAEEEKEPDAAS